jgi:hypothetical protein
LKWHRHLRAEPSGDHRLWEIAVLFHIRDAFRSGDIWLAGSRRYGDLKQLLVPPQAIEQTARLAEPLRPGEWLAERRARLDTRLKEFGRAARTGTIPGGIIENGKLHIDKLRADTPEGPRISCSISINSSRPRGSPICCWKSMSEPDFPRRSRICAPARPAATGSA